MILQGMAPPSAEVLHFPPEPDSKLFPEPGPLVYSADAGTPLVLDLGSYSTRAGWAGQPDPAVSFRTLSGKAKSGTQGDIVNVAGDQLLCRDIVKTAMRSPFDKDVLQNLDSAETILDYTFSRLGINTERVQHPIMVTEPVCAPNYTRGRVYEMLFECYGVPKVAFGIDALLAYEYNCYTADQAAAAPLTAPWQGAAAAGLIVRAGNACSHVIPVVDGRAVLASAFRLNVGGQRISDTLSDSLRLRYPQHRQALTASRVSYIKEHVCSVALDYTDELSRMARELEASEPDAPLSFVKVMQLPYTEKEVPKQTPEDVEKKKKLREEQANRLIEMARVKREEKLAVLTSNLKTLLQCHEQLKTAKGKEAQAPLLEKMQELGVSDVKAADRVLVAMARQLQEVRERHTAKGFKVEAVSTEIQALMDAEDKVETEQELFPLLTVPDNQLSDEDLLKKRRQKMLKGAQDARLKEKQRKAQEMDARKRQREEEELLRKDKPAAWLTQARAERNALYQRFERRAKRKVMGTERRSAASNERMRAILTTLSGAGDKKKSADGCADDGSDFGEDEDDWNVYRFISKDDASDSSDDELEAKLAEIDSRILDLDPSHVPAVLHHPEPEGPSKRGAVMSSYVATERDFQLNLGTEVVQAPEVVFQPSIVGVDQCGLGELLAHLLRRFTSQQAAAMVQNVLVCGGTASLPGFLRRIESELRPLMTPDLALQVRLASDPINDAWRGAARMAAHASFGNVCVTYADWQEMGPHYLAEHRASNRYIPTPAALATDGA